MTDQSVPLSAIRALVQQWREQALDRDGGTEHEAGERAVYLACADQLAALCPAPPEDQP